MDLTFEKYEGLGNDFVVIDDPVWHERMTDDLARRLCDRHRGIGADGVLLAGIEGDRPFMRVINADGSHPEMCGNGLRCVALHLMPLINAIEWEIDTDAGPHRVRTVKFGEVDVFMRAPSLAPHDVPLAIDRPHIDEPFTIEGTTVHLTAVSMGNPHAVIFDTIDEATRLALGPAIGIDARFPEGVNVGFATSRADGSFALRVFERGAGWTEACGTGACAAAVAAVETERAKRGEILTIELPGGLLRITVDEPGLPILMSGPARSVFRGSMRLFL